MPELRTKRMRAFCAMHPCCMRLLWPKSGSGQTPLQKIEHMIARGSRGSSHASAPHQKRRPKRTHIGCIYRPLRTKGHAYDERSAPCSLVGRETAVQCVDVPPLQQSPHPRPAPLFREDAGRRHASASHPPSVAIARFVRPSFGVPCAHEPSSAEALVKRVATWLLRNRKRGAIGGEPNADWLPHIHPELPAVAANARKREKPGSPDCDDCRQQT